MKYYKFIGIISIVVFSFYLTDFITDLAINSNTLMQNIRNNSVNYEVLSVDAIIDDNLSVDNFKIFLKNVINKDLKIVYLSEIILE